MVIIVGCRRALDLDNLNEFFSGSFTSVFKMPNCCSKKATCKENQ